MGGRGSVLFILSAALIRCNTNMQRDTNGILKKMEQIKVAAKHLLKISPLCLSYLPPAHPHVAAHKGRETGTCAKCTERDGCRMDGWSAI